MQSLKGILNFLQTVDCGTFTAAGEVLGISAVAVGKNVASLERELGVRLFQRSTRQLRLTEEGRLLAEQCRLPMRDLEFAYKGIRQRAQSPTGLVPLLACHLLAKASFNPYCPSWLCCILKFRLNWRLKARLSI